VLTYRYTPDGDACTRPGVHDGDCPGDTCTGCARTPAAAGRICCARHEDAVSAALQELPDLYAALGEPTTSTGGGSTASEADQDATPEALPPVIAARSLIRSTLVTWCRVLEDDFGVPLPDERTIADDTRGTILRRQWDVDIAVRALREARTIDARAHLARVAEGHRRAAALLRDERAAGVDVIRALAAHVGDHRSKLLAEYDPPVPDDGRPHDAYCEWWGECWCNPDPYGEAAQKHIDRGRIFAEDILDVAQRARGLAYPRRIVVRILCSCGSRVAVDTDPERYYTCPGCGEYGTLAWWQRREAPPMTSEPMPLSELPEWLLRHHRLAVTLESIRHWAKGARPAISPTELAGVDPVTGRRTPARYDPVAVLAVARAKAERGRRSA
jgi:hypothetical protein